MRSAFHPIHNFSNNQVLLEMIKSVCTSYKVEVILGLQGPKLNRPTKFSVDSENEISSKSTDVIRGQTDVALLYELRPTSG
jgi:hypothetical protein